MGSSSRLLPEVLLHLDFACHTIVCKYVHRWVGGEAGELCSIGELQLSPAGEGSVEVGAGALVAQLVAWGRREGWQVASGCRKG